MKKNILFIMLALFAATSVTFANASLSASKLNYVKPPQIHINFIVAKPRSGCSEFPGICKFSGGGTFDGKVAEGLECNGTAIYDKGVFSFEINESDLNDNLVSLLSKIKYLPVDEEIDIPETITKPLMMHSGSRIQIGKYVLVRTEYGFKVVLAVK